MLKITETKYRGEAALRLATPALELVATTSVGPRVVSLRSREGRAGNLFFELPPGAPRLHGYRLRGGHRLWRAPEDLVLSYQPDDDPVQAAPLPRGISLIQPTERTGLQKSLRLEFPGPSTVKVTHILANRSRRTVTCAPWPITMLRGGGYGVLPLPPKGSHAGGSLLPDYAIVPWSYTDLSLPVWDFHRDFIGIDVPRSREEQKIGLAGGPGWMAYWISGSVFVKFAPLSPDEEYPDLGCGGEAFTNGKMLELETLAPLSRLTPGRRATHVEYWTVLDGMPKPSGDGVFSRSLAPAVRRWLRTL